MPREERPMRRWGPALVTLLLVLLVLLGGDPLPTQKNEVPLVSEQSPPTLEEPVDSASGVPPAAAPDTTAEPSARSAGSISGFVVDDSGASLEGVTVHAFPQIYEEIFLERTHLPDREDPRGRAFSGGEGQFEVPELTLGVRHTVVAQAPRWAGARLIGVLPDSDAVELVLRRGEQIQGVVEDPKGRPVEGALVEVTFAALKGTSGLEIPRLDDVDPGVVWPTTTTDASGSFTLDGVTNGEFGVKASHEAYFDSETVNLTTGTSGISLVLRAAGRIRGRVQDEGGEPIARVRVQLRAVGHDSEWTDEEGHFAFGKILDCSYSVTVAKTGFVTAHEYGELSEGSRDHDLEITLRRGGVVRAKILSAEGNPQPDAQAVVAMEAQQADSSYLAQFPSGVTTDDGSLEISGIPDPSTSERELVLSISAPKHFDLHVEGVRVPPDGEVDLGVIQLEPSFRLLGRVIDPSGAPIENAEVFVGRDSTKSDASGNFELWYRESRDRLSVHARDFQQHRASFDPKANFDDHPLTITLEKPQLLRLSGRVQDRSGAPVTGLTIQALAGYQEHSKTLDPDGQFEFEGLEPRPHVIRFRPTGWRIVGEVPVYEAGSEGLVIVVDPPGQIEGTVTAEESGQPIANFQLISVSPELEDPHNVLEQGLDLDLEDPEGNFHLVDRAAARHFLRVEAEGYGWSVLEVDVLPGQVPTPVSPITMMA